MGFMDEDYMSKYDYFDKDGNKLKNVAAIECCAIRNDNSITCTFNKDDLLIENLLYASDESRDAAFRKLRMKLLELAECMY